MIVIQTFNAHPRHRIRRAETLRLARRVLKGERRTSAECNIVFVDDKRMEKMNGEYLNHWYATDVLSFPLTENGKKKVDGEVYVNLDQARRQSREYKVTMKNEVHRLVIHGLLHLLGYNDKTKRERQRMTHRENLYLRTT